MASIWLCRRRIPRSYQVIPTNIEGFRSRLYWQRIYNNSFMSSKVSEKLFGLFLPLLFFISAGKTNQYSFPLFFACPLLIPVICAICVAYFVPNLQYSVEVSQVWNIRSNLLRLGFETKAHELSEAVKNEIGITVICLNNDIKWNFILNIQNIPVTLKFTHSCIPCTNIFVSF